MATRSFGICIVVALTAFGVILCCPPKKDLCPDPVSLFCRCGLNDSRPLVETKVKGCPIGASGNCEPCLELRDVECKKFRNCDSCPQGKNGTTCEIRGQKSLLHEHSEVISPDGYPIIMEFPAGKATKVRVFGKPESNTSRGYPVIMEFPPGRKPDRRAKRAEKDKLAGCVPHDGLETAEVKCWIWPTHVTCEERCVHGYKVKGHRTLTSKCNEKNPGEWYPDPLEECKPYVNCEAQLTSPGDLKCFELTMEPQKCFVKCEEYADQPAVRLREYICKETFDPALPHCAELDPNYQVFND